MSKELTERLRKFIGGELGNGAADALESLEADRDSWERQAGDRLDDVLRVVAERDALAAELKAVRGDQSPTVEDINLQEWKGMDGACAWHLIDRHADDWNHIARLMNAWLEANREGLAAELKALREQEPVSHEFQAQDGSWRGFINESHYKNTVEDGSWPIRALYAHPVPARELTDADIALCIASADKSFAQERISGKPVLGVWSKHLARAIERYLKGEGK